MADLLSIGTSGIRVYQRSLATTGNNIANVDNDGFSRQEHNIEEAIGVSNTAVNVGSGALSASVRRVYDQFATASLRNSTSSLEHQDAMYAYARKLENILGDTNTSVTSMFDRFFSAAHDLSISPSSDSVRGSLLSEANNVAELFHSISAQFSQQDEDSFVEIKAHLTELNTLAKQLASVNQQLFNRKDESDQPNGLLDQRDKLLQDISQLTRISTSERKSGVVDVYLGSAATGTAFIDGDKAKSISAERIQNNPEKLTFTFDPYGNPETINNMVGGKIAGIDDFRNNALSKARDDLDTIALGFMSAVNQVQTDGLDANGNYGNAMFGLSNNEGRASMSLEVLINGGDEIATGAPLMVNQNGSAATFKLMSWGLDSASTLQSGEQSIQSLWDASVAENAAREEPDDLSNLSWSLNNGERFVIEGNSVKDLTLSVGSGVQIFTRDGQHLYGSALANPENLMIGGNGFRADATYDATYLNQTGEDSYKDVFTIDQQAGVFHFKGQLSEDLIVIANDGAATFSGGWLPPTKADRQAQMLSEVEVSFTDATTYTLTDVNSGTVIGTRNYALGDTIELNGWTAVLQNTPTAGDSFIVSRNNSARGDNQNILSMIELQTDRDVFQGRGNFSEVYADMINDLGSVVVQTQVSRDAQQVLVDEAKETRDSVSAVSLDEEAANLLRFQQAYQASAQIIQAANRLFDVIIGIR